MPVDKPPDAIRINISGPDDGIIAIVTHLALNQVSKAIQQQTHEPHDNQFDLNGGHALFIQFGTDRAKGDRFYYFQEEKLSNVNKPTGQTAKPAIVVVAGFNTFYNDSTLEKWHAFCAKSSLRSTPLTPAPVVLTFGVTLNPNKEVHLPALTRQQWKDAYIPQSLHSTPVVNAIADIVGPTLPRVDTLILVSTLLAAKKAWNPSLHNGITFDSLFKDNKFPPALLISMVEQLLRFGLTQQYDHLPKGTNSANFRVALQRMLVIAKYEDLETHKLSGEQKKKCLALLHEDEASAKEILRATLTQLHEFAGWQGETAIASPTLVNLLRLLNEQQIIVQTETTTTIYDSRRELICGSCGSAATIGKNCTHCSSPAINHEYHLIPIVK